LNRSAGQRALLLLSILCAAVPFAFGAIRAIATGSDLRSLWMALASGAGTAGIMAANGVRARPLGSVLGLSVLVFAVATLPAFVTGYLLGVTVGPGGMIVAGSMGLCWAAHFFLRSLSLPS
jgi:hypothetical protein